MIDCWSGFQVVLALLCRTMAHSHLICKATWMIEPQRIHLSLKQTHGELQAYSKQPAKISGSLTKPLTCSSQQKGQVPEKNSSLLFTFSFVNSQVDHGSVWITCNTEMIKNFAVLLCYPSLIPQIYTLLKSTHGFGHWICSEIQTHHSLSDWMEKIFTKTFSCLCWKQSGRSEAL